VDAEIAANTALRFLPAERVRCGVYRFERFAVKNEAAEPIGDLAGFIIDPPARKVRFAVVNPRGLFARPCLVPVADARLDSEAEALMVNDSLSGCEAFDRARFPEISDEDVLTAVFAA
jgi:hypothetical protein